MKTFECSVKKKDGWSEAIKHSWAAKILCTRSAKKYHPTTVWNMDKKDAKIHFLCTKNAPNFDLWDFPCVKSLVFCYLRLNLFSLFSIEQTLPVKMYCIYFLFLVQFWSPRAPWHWRSLNPNKWQHSYLLCFALLCEWIMGFTACKYNVFIFTFQLLSLSQGFFLTPNSASSLFTLTHFMFCINDPPPSSRTPSW